MIKIEKPVISFPDCKVIRIETVEMTEEMFEERKKALVGAN